jgi:predicted ribosome quality control (RQC) complex YloA/Tae2 family protein
MAAPSDASSSSSPERERAAAILRAARRFHRRLVRKIEALRGDLAEAERGPLFRRHGEALLAYLKQVPARAKEVSLPDPAHHARTIEIVLDPALTAQANAARYFKRAAKAERGLADTPGRIAATEKEAEALEAVLGRIERALEGATGAAPPPALERDATAALAKLPPAMRDEIEPPSALESTPARVARGDARAPSSRLQPRRLKTREGWDVLIGRNNDGNDYLTHHLARPEDYWFHVHGASGSHVVLRRGKSPSEPSKQTIEEVAAWTAFYSQARTAGKVPVIVTRKKYVRKPRKAPPGLVVCEREKSVMVRPKEPPKDALADEA